MIVIVGQSVVSVEELSRRSLLPSVDSLRPSSCPGCDQLAHPAGERLGIVGHGTYTRQVLGLESWCSRAVIWVRRFVCRGCRRTISVLPDVLYPGRWYAGVAILLGLFFGLLQEWRVEEVRRQLSGQDESGGWKTLRRWQRQLLCPLWGWLGRQVGIEDAPSLGRVESRRRLFRLLSLWGLDPATGPAEVEAAARSFVRGTAHDGTRCLHLSRDRRGDS